MGCGASKPGSVDGEVSPVKKAAVAVPAAPVPATETKAEPAPLTDDEVARNKVCYSERVGHAESCARATTPARRTLRPVTPEPCPMCTPARLPPSSRRPQCSTM